MPFRVVAAGAALRRWVEDHLRSAYDDSDPTQHVDLHSPQAQRRGGLFTCPDHGDVTPLPGKFSCPYETPYDPEADQRPVVKRSKRRDDFADVVVPMRKRRLG